MAGERWSPKEQRSRNKWQSFLAKIQYRTEESADELHQRLHEEGEKRAKEISPSSLDTNEAELDYDDTNPAHYILKYLSGKK